jgi:hypothetical protein
MSESISKAACCPVCSCKKFDYQLLEIRLAGKPEFVVLIKCADNGHVLGVINDPHPPVDS